jgi:CheY-like chemotaxis protein
MSRILLADDSPHAQRMGERILREEGFEIVTVTDGETALIRLADTDPDVVLADVFLPLRSGYEICQYIKNHPRYCHARVVLLAGLLEPVDEAAASRVGADGVLKKPFEASAVVAMIRPLAEAAEAARASGEAPEPEPEPEAEAAAEAEEAEPEPEAEAVAEREPAPEPAAEPEAEAVAEAPEPAPAEVVIDAERVRAAVTVALDRAMPAMIDEITERVLVALGQ